MTRAPCPEWHPGDGSEHLPCAYELGHAPVLFGDVGDQDYYEHANPEQGVGWNGDPHREPRPVHPRPMSAQLAAAIRAEFTVTDGSTRPVRRALILAAAHDAGSDLVHQRDDDEDLPPGSIQAAVAAGEISEAEIVEAFHAGMRSEGGWTS